MTPPTPSATDAITIATVLENATDVTLTFRIDFEAPVTVPMADNGDNSYFAVIGAQPAGTLIRYRVDTAEGISSPAATDSIDYFGVVVGDPTVTTGGAPIFQWFIDNADYQTMIEDTLNRDISVRSVLAYDGVVYDNVATEIRGGNYARRNSPKQSFNFDMPSGHDFVAPGLLAYPVDEFAMQAEYGDDLFGRAETSWWFFEQAGFPHVHSFGVRLQQNGDFFGAYRFQEKLDGTWRSETGYDTGEFYKADLGGFQSQNGFDRKVPDGDDPTHTNTVATGIDQQSRSARTAFLFDTFDVPALINYAAAIAIVGHDDSKYHNFYAHFDAEGDNRWSIVTWDMDITWGFDVRGCNDLNYTTLDCLDDDLMNAIYESPELFAMFWARVKTLADDVLSRQELHDMHDARIALMGAEVGALEEGRWDRDLNMADQSSIDEFHEAVQDRRDAFANEPRVPTLGDPSDVVISEILADPVDGAPEILELINTGTKPVDMSGWQIDAVFKDGQAMPQGTIILPGKRVVLTDSIADVDQTYPNLPDVVLVQYNGGLKRTGEKVELVTPDGTVADMVDYGDTDWPSDLPEGTSLELISTALDNGQPASWAIATVDGGTPGQRNSVDPYEGTELSVFAYGSTGEEQASVVINGTTSYEIGLSTDTEEFTFTTDETVDDVRVIFLNDQSSPVDRNLTVDAITINGKRYETEADTVESVGSWNPDSGCNIGLKRSEKLHCDGYFHFIINVASDNPGSDNPDTGGEDDSEDGSDDDGDGNDGSQDSEVTVFAYGATGDERASVVINDGTTYEFAVTTDPAEYTFTTDETIDDVRVHFLNDQSRPVDRNLFIDAIEVDGERYESEADTVESVGSWNPDSGCNIGFKQSEKLHCDGYFHFIIAAGGDSPNMDDPNSDDQNSDDQVPDMSDGSSNSEVTVMTWGATGDEQAVLLVNGDISIPIDVSTTRTQYTYAIDEQVTDVRVSFVNDQATPVDRNLFVDAIIVDGKRYESEADTVQSLGSWNPDSGCNIGFKQSEKLHCDGYFQYVLS